MKKFLTLILTALLFTSIAQAKLGDTLEETMEKHPSFDLVGKEPFNDRVTIAVFTNSETGEEVGIFVFDGKVAEEVISHADGSKLDEGAMILYIKSYSEKWTPIGHPTEGVNAIVSEDGKIFALYGPAPWLKRDHALRIFTKEWHDYCQSIGKDKI